MTEKNRINHTHPYIPHLLDDIKAAQRDEEASLQDDAEESIEEHFEQIDRWIAGEYDGHTFGNYCGLESINFPPPEQLNERDMELICDAFEELLASWNAGISLPDNVPLPLRYTLTVGTLNEEFVPMKMGSVIFDYCSGYAPDCPLKEYCPCLEVWNNDDDSVDTNE